MSKIASFVLFGLLASIISSETRAVPVSPAAIKSEKTEVVVVRDFCGLGAHRSAYGYCVPNGVVVVPPPAYYVAPPLVAVPPVVCPYGYYYYVPYGRCVPTP